MNEILKRAWAEVHLDRAEKNLRILMSQLDLNYTKPVCVVKANAYGHGSVELSALYQGVMGIDCFAVSNADEAYKLRGRGCNGDILILSWSPTDKTSLECLNKWNIIQTVVSYEHAKEISENACGEIRIHIALDTGMGRVGLCTDNTDECVKNIQKIAAMPNLKIEGIFTHFAVADSFEQEKVDYTNEQKNRFFDVIEKCSNVGITFRHKHCTNSAAALIHNDNRSTLARLGITLYGLKPDTSLTLPDGIEPIMDLKAVVSHVKTIHKGQSVSYGRTFIADKDTIVATIPIGYADGYSRLLSGKTEVLIHGKRAKGIGRICMDQMMIDVTDIPDVKMGDICTLIGRDGDEIITADDLAELYGTIGYEVTSCITARVPRAYYMNGECVRPFTFLV